MQRLNRRIANKIEDALQASPVVFLNGPRQAGKSTLVQMIAGLSDNKKSDIDYVTFDRPTAMAAAAAAPEAFLSSYPGQLIIDEVQLVPEVFRALKIVVDELRLSQNTKVNGRYLLTGSANILALPKLSDPLVGRMSVLTLYPFCTAEATGGAGDAIDRMMRMDFRNMTDRGITLLDAIEKATFPEIYNKTDKVKQVWFDGYISTILQRDVRLIADLEKAAALPVLLRLIATRAGNLLNDSELARDIGLSSVTGKVYRNVLKMMFLTFEVQPWFRNIGKRLVKAPKGYLTDTQLLCHMLDMNVRDIAKNKPDIFGHVLENFVATELIKLLSFSEIKGQLLHFRTSDGKEVDFIIERPDGSVFAIEVKKTESLNIHDFRGIQAFADLNPKEFIGGIVLYSGADAVPFGTNLWAVPFHLLWQ